MELAKEMRKLDVDGYIRFNIRAKNTAHNEEVHKEFQTYAKEVCDDNYTLALERLLEYVRSDAKTEMLWEAIKELHTRIDEVEPKTNEPVPKKEGTVSF